MFHITESLTMRPCIFDFFHGASCFQGSWPCVRAVLLFLAESPPSVCTASPFVHHLLWTFLSTSDCFVHSCCERVDVCVWGLVFRSLGAELGVELLGQVVTLCVFCSLACT